MKSWDEWRAAVDLDGYDARWQHMADTGQNPHGEADFVGRYSPTSVLDAGCGTGRVGIELSRRGVQVVGVDLDPDLVARARQKAPALTWHQANLAGLHLGQRFDVVVMAGNVIPYVAPADRAEAVAGAARHVASGGYLIAGFSLQSDWPTLADYDLWCTAVGCALTDRFSTWDGALYDGGPYAVSVHHLSPLHRQ